MNKKQPLYIFLHMPKCAGSTFTYHIQKNLKPDEYLACYAHDFCFDTKPMGKYFLHQTEQEIQHITEIQKSKLKILYGHGIPYGIHTFFPNRTPYYSTFFRDPVKRTLSSYNFQRARMEDTLPPDVKKYYQTFIMRQGKPLSFEVWLKEYYDHLPQLPVGVTMTTFLSELGYLPKKKTYTTSDFSTALSRFSFIGITEHYDTDALYLYYLLDINKFYSKKNVSHTFIHTDISTYRRSLEEKNATDIALYTYARQWNRQFYRTHPEVNRIQHYKKVQRSFFYPVTQSAVSLPTMLYRLSAQMKRSIPRYERLVTKIKSIRA